MTITYLPEHLQNAQFALDLAQREAAHLAYTSQTLFSQPIDIAWVEAIKNQPERAEKIDAFVSRFGRLQDHLGEKALPLFSKLLGGTPKSLLDTLAYAEKMQWLDNAETFIGSRKLRNQLIHEYLKDPELFLEALLAAQLATEMLQDTVRRLSQHMNTLLPIT